MARHTPFSAPEHDEIRILIVTPTAARAFQVAEKARALAADKTGVRIHCLVGGKNPVRSNERPMIAARRADIVVATPGRLLDHLIFNPSFKDELSKVRSIVYDSVDELQERQANEWLPAIQTFLPSRHSILRIN
ncbi:hypothetical protein BD410DRAFT_65371 [Rickenella mellea]|uniref:ATP-dependent RNA helicase n=1 Tax=Rickenella mellea TaxID=50990 RepID=A0A4Y7QC72_9AGAM|nr:hypothetical protein BD410DRAFT_65371 [Rickenella mellea]